MTLTLLNVTYVSNFMTNVVSQAKLHAKGVYFDSWKMHLHREGETYAHVDRHGGHFVVENNPY